jgi:hypothetical protein
MEATEGTGVAGSQRLIGTLLIIPSFPSRQNDTSNREATKARNPQNELLDAHATAPHNTTAKSNQTLKPCMASANDEVKGMPSETARKAKVMN